MHPTQFFKTKAACTFFAAGFTTLVAASGGAPPATVWHWILLIAGCLGNGTIALKAYLSDASANRAP